MSTPTGPASCKLNEACEFDREELIAKLTKSATYHNVVSVPKREDAEVCADRVAKILMSRMNGCLRIGDFVIYKNDLRRVAAIHGSTSETITIQFQSEEYGSTYYVNHVGVEQGGGLDSSVELSASMKRVAYLNGSYWTYWRNPGPRTGVYFKFPAQVWNADTN